MSDRAKIEERIRDEIKTGQMLKVVIGRTELVYCTKLPIDDNNHFTYDPGSFFWKCVNYEQGDRALVLTEPVLCDDAFRPHSTKSGGIILVHLFINGVAGWFDFYISNFFNNVEVVR